MIPFVGETILHQMATASHLRGNSGSRIHKTYLKVDLYYVNH